MEDSLSMIGFIILALLAVFILLKTISFIFKLLILAVMVGVMYYFYGQYPTEVLSAGVIIFAVIILFSIAKKTLFNKK